MSDQDQILLLTKLHRPPITGRLIARPQLTEKLNDGINRPLTLVLASAGFGKTTLVSAWLEERAVRQFSSAASFPAAWLSLDENDSNLINFLRYFIAALRTIFPDVCKETLMLLQARQQPPLELLYDTLSNDIEQLSEDFILVLDDYHTIHGEEVHGLLNVLAHHWPKPLHMVLISRISPPIPLSGLRAKGMITDIRAQHLRLTPEETAAFLSQSQVDHLSQSTLDLLEKRFEGWIAGLHLITIALHQLGNQEAVLSVISSENLNITDYLVDEVLRYQLPVIRTFLLKTSILNRFCASLCEAVIGEIDPTWNAGDCLEWIERSELFLVPLDDHREWYRYHHLFQELLRHRLSTEMVTEEVKELHLRASAWFEERGLVDEALQQALAAGDIDLVACKMKAGLCEVINREDRPTLERWLSLLPEELIQRDPGLLMIRVWALQLSWRLDLQLKVIQQVEELLDSGAGVALPEGELQFLRGQIFLIKAQYAYLHNQTSLAIDLCRQVLAILPPSWTFVRGAAMLYLGLAMQANGEVRAAETLLLDEYELCVDKTDLYPMVLLQSLGYIYLWTGQPRKAIQVGGVLTQGAIHSGITFTENWGDYFIGMASYQCNDLETSEQHFTKILKNHYIAHGSAYRDAVAGLALIHQIKGESANAWQLLEAISRSDIEETGAEDSRTGSLRARLQLLQGDLEGARRWVESFSSPPPDQPIIWLEEPQVTRARVLLARGAESDLRMAQQILDVLEDITDRTHNTRFKIEILALRALALEALGETTEANTILKQALELAYPGGLIRVFVDLGTPMQKMLHQLEEQGLSVEMIQRILAAFQEDDKNLFSSGSPAPPSRSPSLRIPTLAGPLTPRELDILILLQKPLSNKEIAQKLHISYETAKRHIANIYDKLGVNRRWDAVARAIELGILPPD